MQARYRTDYAGEFVILETRWSGGKKEQSREWIANPIENHHISGRAACIGSDFDANRFDHVRLQRHRGGLLGSKKLQTYGVGNIAASMRLDFAVETCAAQLAALKESGYAEKNIVYTTARQCLAWPGEFYLIPLSPKLLDIATLPYLAAFDGHQEIFMLGYNRETAVENATWSQQVRNVVDAYPAVKFYFVGEASNMYEAWLEPANTQSMTHREFIGYCDV
jgi:hypothetical protein